MAFPNKIWMALPEEWAVGAACDKNPTHSTSNWRCKRALPKKKVSNSISMVMGPKAPTSANESECFQPKRPMPFVFPVKCALLQDAIDTK
jgi:hypothetical protein